MGSWFCQHISLYGYGVRRGVIQRELALEIAGMLEANHTLAQLKYIDGNKFYNTIDCFGVDGQLDAFAVNPRVTSVVDSFLGDGFYSNGMNSKIVMPGCTREHLHDYHIDDLKYCGGKLPKLPFLINTIWMLTDFTVENGATAVVPASHHLDLTVRDIAAWVPFAKTINGKAGDVIFLRGGVIHSAQANSSNRPRLAVNIPYYAKWFKRL